MICNLERGNKCDINSYNQRDAKEGYKRIAHYVDFRDIYKYIRTWSPEDESMTRNTQILRPFP